MLRHYVWYQLGVRADRKVVLEALRNSPCGGILGYFERADEWLKQDRDYVLQAVRYDALNLKFASPALRADRQVVLEAIRNSYLGCAFEYADETLKEDRVVVFEAVQKHGENLKFASPALRADRQVVLEAIRNGFAFDLCRPFEYADETLKQDRGFVLEAVQIYGDVLLFASPALRADRQVVLEAIRNSYLGRAFKYADEKLKQDRGFVLEALSAGLWLRPKFRRDFSLNDEMLLLSVLAKQDISDILAIKWHPSDDHYGNQVWELLDALEPKLKDRGFVETALQWRPKMGFETFLFFTSFRAEIPLEISSLSAETRVVLLFHGTSTAQDVKEKALRKAGLSIATYHLDLVYGTKIVDDNSPIRTWIDLQECTDIPFCNLVQHWGRIVADDGLFLEHAPDGCKADVDIVQKACAQNGMALQCARDDLRANEKVVLTAVGQDGMALELASDDLRGKFEIASPAVQNNGMALEFASDNLRENDELVQQAVQQNGMALQFSFLGWQEDVVLSAVQQNGLALEFAHPVLWSNAEILKSAIRQNAMALKWADLDNCPEADAITLEAVQQNGMTLEYASADQRETFKIVLAAVQQNGMALEFAFIQWESVALSAVKQNGLSLQFAEHFCSNMDIVMSAVQQNGMALEFADLSGCMDPMTIALEAIKQNGIALQFAPEPLRSDPSIVAAAMRQGEDADQTASS